MDIFYLLNHFSRAEDWGDPDKMDPCILLILERMRVFGGYPINIHCAFERYGHAEKSMHPEGKATDFHLVGISLEKADNMIQGFLEENSLIDHVGLGIYPEWNNPGFHLDTRGFKARWAKVNGVYVAYEEGLK